jgi:hypothetical protein
VQYKRWLNGVFWNVATWSAPDLTRTASDFQSVKALAGAPDQERQELQWQ